MVNSIRANPLKRNLEKGLLNKKKILGSHLKSLDDIIVHHTICFYPKAMLCCADDPII